MSVVNFDYIATGYSRKAQKLLDMLSNDSKVRTDINYIIGDALNQFVPMKSGDLRRSMYADNTGIHWYTPYAHYQYMGVVYAPNFPIRDGNHTIIGWKTKHGIRKYPTARLLGTPGFLDGWRFGYTTPGTTSNWAKFYTANQWTMGGSVKADTNQKIMRYLKAECRSRGLNV